MTDKQLIDMTIRTNLNLIKTMNRNPDEDGIVFKKSLLVIGRIRL